MDAETLYLLAQRPTGLNSYPSNTNLIQNGAMEIWQRLSQGNTYSVSANSYTADRWYLQGFNNTYVTAATLTAAPTTSYYGGTGIAPPGFNSALGVTVNTADVNSQVANRGYNLSQNIEGINVTQLAWGTSSGVPVTLTFWVQSSQPGTYSASIKNYAATRCYVSTYTIPTANTWTKISIVIPPDTTGTWVTGTNAASLNLTFDLGNGIQYRSPITNTWLSAGYIGAMNQTNWVANVGNTFYITGVQLSLGTSTPSVFSRFAPNYAGEFQACLRYYNRMDVTVANQATGGNVFTSYSYCAGSTSVVARIDLPVVMRAVPTLSTSGNSTLNWSNTLANQAVSTTIVDVFTTNSVDLTLGLAGAGNTSGGWFARGGSYGFGSPAWIDFSADI